ncbi:MULTISPECIES: hypothetical protein [Cytobacillus]|uniref:hypothetical protein n=1 Tax=Cytobacillus TaxID=2675230 RepID=UPI00203DC567|nr:MULTISPECIES: hypothetical protein [Cytobacillus]MCM3404594.1 hypothetical protein [Cytobacillus oceanisediminis]MDK7666181.1 hypothetical protein [Cytobacillus oceanisediminis]UQX55277.1 hypothetical protein M5V91_06005 [Cytobacillus pseudoceanisediminis]
MNQLNGDYLELLEKTIQSALYLMKLLMSKDVYTLVTNKYSTGIENDKKLSFIKGA